MFDLNYISSELKKAGCSDDDIVGFMRLLNLATKSENKESCDKHCNCKCCSK